MVTPEMRIAAGPMGPSQEQRSRFLLPGTEPRYFAGVSLVLDGVLVLSVSLQMTKGALDTIVICGNYGDLACCS